MTTEEKTKAILEAVKSKRVTGIKLDVSGRGKAITRIKQGKASKEVVDKIYAKLVELLGIPESLESQEEKQEQGTQKEDTQEAQEQETKTEPQPEKGIKMDANMLNKIAERFEGIERENQTLKETIASLQGEIEALKQVGITRDNQVSIINNIPDSTGYNKKGITKDNQAFLKDYERLLVDGLDFIIRLEKQVSNVLLASGKSKKIEYPRYYAKKKIAGKLHRIYLGEIADRTNSIEKIKAYCEKHSLSLSPVV